MKNQLRFFVSVTIFSLALVASTVFATTSSFSQYLEAESGTLSSPMAIGSDSMSSGGSYVSTPNTDLNNLGTGGSLSLSVNIPSSGTYIIWGKVLSIDSNADSFYVSVDGGAEDVWDTAEKTWSPSWQWTRVTARGDNGGSPSINNANPHSFNLSAGVHTLKFRGRDGNTKLDRIFITNDTSAVPSGATNPPAQPPTSNPSTVTLSVLKSGSGSGTISGSGISCGSTCSLNVNSGTFVTLSATPDSGSTFTGWSGATCSGTSCSVPMDSSKSVTAIFTASSQPPVQTGCTNPPSVPGTASPCPVLSLSQTTISRATPLTITLTPGGEKYIYKTIYVSKGSSTCSGTDWCSFDLPSPYVYSDWKQTSSPVSVTIPANTLSVGTHYILGLDWTLNGGCYIGPGSTSCGGGSWRLQRVDVTN